MDWWATVHEVTNSWILLLFIYKTENKVQTVWEYGKNHKVKVFVAQSRLTLCDPLDCSPPGFSVHGILQERILEWAAIPSPEDLPQPRYQTQVSCMAGRFCTI